MKQIIAVIGNANIENDFEKQKISYELGKLIIDNGYVLATGGLGGVMEYASKGAKNSKNYTENSIIGVLPDYNSENANKYIDIALPTGFGLARNLMLVSLANAVIAVGGGSGTLNEISASWQMNKLLIGLQVNGWSEKLCGKALDKRRNDIIYCAKTADEAIKILNRKISYYQIRKFTGVKKPRINTKKAEKIVTDYFATQNNLNFLGKGSEGFVFTDKEYILLKYKYEETSEFIVDADIDIDKFIELLKQFRKIKWTLTDFKPQNLRITKDGNLLVIDIGKSFLPTSKYLFESMCRRAFVTYKLQGKLTNSQDFKKYLTPVNETADFSLMTEFGFVENELKQEFDNFYKKIITVGKKDILNPIIKDIFLKNIKVKSVFDYGSGYGDMSKLLKDINLQVIAYEPDKEVVKKYKRKYYKNIDCLNYAGTKNIIENNTKFDSVLCSLILCHPLAETKHERLEIIHQIMTDITALSNKYIVMVVCNPLYTYQSCSTLQKRILPKNFNYKNEYKFTKKIYSSGRERFDIHRPISFYEELFKNYKLDIKEIIQTSDTNQTKGIKNSDFMIFILKHNNNG